MASQIERDGALFYAALLKSRERRGERLCLELAAMEEDHEITFENMRLIPMF